MLKLYSNTYANCDLKDAYTCKCFKYVCTNIRKVPTPLPPPPNKQESLVKIDVFSDNKYFLKIPLYSSVGVKK